PEGLPWLVEVTLGEIERFLDSQPRPPEHDDQAANAVAVDAVAGLPHHRHDLLDPWRIRRIAQSLVSRRAPLVIARHRRRRAPAPGRIDARRWAGRAPIERRRALQ